jgi:DNA-binding MarR family transcriptional regulator
LVTLKEQTDEDQHRPGYQTGTPNSGISDQRLVNQSLTRWMRAYTLMCMVTSPTDAGQTVVSPYLCMCANVRRAARSITQLYDAALAPSGIGIAQFSLLGMISVEPDASRTELATAMAMDRTTLARNLQLLERAGLIESLAGSDKRVRRVRLTDAGRRAQRRALPHWLEVQSRLRRALGEECWNEATARLKDLEELHSA